MPLVERVMEQQNESTTYQKQDVKYVIYVAPGKVLRSDKIVEPESSAQLAELASQYPDEYAEMAKQKGVTPGIQSADNVRLNEIMAMPSKEIVKTIAGLDPDEDEALLWSIFEAETADAGQQRKAILTALAKQGVQDSEGGEE